MLKLPFITATLAAHTHAHFRAIAGPLRVSLNLFRDRTFLVSIDWHGPNTRSEAEF